MASVSATRPYYVTVTGDGAQITATLTDSDNTLAGVAVYGSTKANLIPVQGITSRQIIVGSDSGHLAVSYDSGVSWASSLPAASQANALALLAHAASDYPHGYLGLASGALYKISETQGAIAALSTALVATLSSAITALWMPPSGRGRVWIGCADGSVRLYAPSAGTPYIVAQLADPVTALAGWGDSDVVLVACKAGSGVSASGLALVMERVIGGTVLVYDHSQNYTDLSAARRTALLAVGTTGLTWTTDGLASLGTTATPLTGAATCGGINPFDPNEWVLANAAGAKRTTNNGQTFTSTSLTGATKILWDPDFTGTCYALAANGGAHVTLYVSYDGAATWASIAHGLSGDLTALALGNITMVG